MSTLKVIIHIIVVFIECWLVYSNALEPCSIPALQRCAAL